MHAAKKSYLPAAGSDWLLPFFDPFTKLLGVEASHRRLVEQAGLDLGDRVLEIGCGTGNLAILAKQMNPAVEVTGIDPDPKAIARARRKAERKAAPVRFDEGFAEELPYRDASFDRVFSAFMLHHLPQGLKPIAMREASRVLRPGGSLHLVDFDRPERPSRGLHGFLASTLHARHGSSQPETVLVLLREAGFVDPRPVAHQNSLMGRIVYYRGSVIGDR